MKLIFLDFDGVLNSDKYFTTDEFIQEFRLFGEPYVKLDPAKIKLLNKLVEQSGASVVISSAWRIGHSLEELNFYLKSRGAKFEAIDMTPRRSYDCGLSFIWTPRGEEIQQYIDKIIVKPESIVILDDYEDMVHLCPYLVQTNPMVGLNEKDVEKALQILEKDYGSEKSKD